jgi:hypothetical protein
MKELKAKMVIVMLLLSSFLAMVGGSPLIGALDITTFADDATEKTIMFKAGGGTNDSIEVLIPANSMVASAKMNVSGLPYTPGGLDYPEEIKIDERLWIAIHTRRSGLS